MTENEMGAQHRAATGADNPPPLRRADNFVHSVATVSGTLGSLVILVMTLLVVADVSLRSFFNTPIKGTSEIGAFLVTAVVFLQAPLAAYEQRLTRVEWFEQWLGGKSSAAGLVHGLAIDAAGAVAFLLIADASLPGLIEAWATSEFFGTQGHFTAPSWPVRLTIVACSILAAIAFLIRMAIRVAAFRRRV